MARKKKEEEHENLERWLVSYGDFITLLFATFVVLYALAQVDAEDFSKLEESLKNAFSQNTLLEGQESVFDGQNSIFDSQQMANSFIPSLMVEYISPKYEQDSFKDINEEIKDLADTGDIEGISSKMTDKGLLITFNDDTLFAPGSADLNSKSKKALDKIGLMICKKFVLHKMVIEGHTDDKAIHNAQFPSNWELSSARSCSVVRYLISRFKFSPKLFTATGYADTRQPDGIISPSDPKNRRVEILILKNKFKDSMETTAPVEMSLTKAQQEKIQADRERIINSIGGSNLSEAAQKLLYDNQKDIEVQRTKHLSDTNMQIYVNIGNEDAMNKATDKKPQKVIKLDSTNDEDFGL